MTARPSAPRLTGCAMPPTPVPGQLAARLLSNTPSSACPAQAPSPWNITAFLDSCAARGLVQRVGGGWRFPHNLIRDYFVELEVRGEEQEAA